jgi:hypothetical protein
MTPRQGINLRMLERKFGYMSVDTALSNAVFAEELVSKAPVNSPESARLTTNYELLLMYAELLELNVKSI